jgi:MFS family permease
MRGRVMAFFTMVYRGAPALGAVLMGWVAEWAGLQNAVAGGAVACLLIWGWAMRKRRTMASALETPGG